MHTPHRTVFVCMPTMMNEFSHRAWVRISCWAKNRPIISFSVRSHSTLWSFPATPLRRARSSPSTSDRTLRILHISDAKDLMQSKVAECLRSYGIHPHAIPIQSVGGRVGARMPMWRGWGCMCVWRPQAVKINFESKHSLSSVHRSPKWTYGIWQLHICLATFHPETDASFTPWNTCTCTRAHVSFSMSKHSIWTENIFISIVWHWLRQTARQEHQH